MKYRFNVGDSVSLLGVDDLEFLVSDRGFRGAGSKRANFYSLSETTPPSRLVHQQIPERVLKKTRMFCIVCMKSVKVENGLVHSHQWNGAVCYGSFLPENAP